MNEQGHDHPESDPSPPTVPVPSASPLRITVPWARPVSAPGARYGPPSVATAAPDPMLLSDASRGSVAIDILVVIVMVVVVVIAVDLFAFLAGAVQLPVRDPAIVGADADGSTSQMAYEVDQDMLVPLTVLRGVLLVIVVGVILLARRQPAATLGITRRSIASNLGLGLITTFLIMASLIVLGILILTFSGDEPPIDNARVLMELLPPMSPVTIVAFSIAVGIYEEVLFRGFLMTRLRRLTGSWIPAVILSTGLFVTLHLDQQGVARFAIGGLSLIFSGLTIWRKSIVPAIVAHAMFDLTQLMLLNIARDHMPTLPG